MTPTQFAAIELLKDELESLKRDGVRVREILVNAMTIVLGLVEENTQKAKNIETLLDDARRNIKEYFAYSDWSNRSDFMDDAEKALEKASKTAESLTYPWPDSSEVDDAKEELRRGQGPAQDLEEQDIVSCIREACEEGAAKALRKHREGSKGWDTSEWVWLLSRLHDEVDELEKSIYRYDFTNAADECLDVLNFAAFLRVCLLRRPEARR